MDITKYSKALAGALAGLITGLGQNVAIPELIQQTIPQFVNIPADLELPWWAYVLLPVINAAIGYLIVAVFPANRPTGAQVIEAAQNPTVLAEVQKEVAATGNATPVTNMASVATNAANRPTGGLF